MAFLQDSQPDLCLLAKSGGCSVYQLRNESGEGTMTVYEVFPGATILYNDFHMAYCDSSFETRQDLLCIDYCREGRMEYAVGNDAFSYVEAGDLKVDRRLKHKGYFSLPLSHYHGISMCFDLSMIPMELARLAGDYPLDLAAIQQKFCPDARPRVIHGAPSVDHIFQELRTVPERIKMPYFRVKILELLLYLDALELGSGTEKPYFYRSQVETVKAIRSYLVEHLDQHITLEALSRQYQIPLTTMKACFKSVYGSPVNTYMRALRMDRAALLLRKEPEASVTEIAGAVGYDSSSKFAAAFRAVKGQTPLEYRRGGGNPVLSFPDETE